MSTGQGLSLDFCEAAEHAYRVVNVDAGLEREVVQSADYYGLDERERRLLPVELTFFICRATSRVAESYSRAYEDAARNVETGLAQVLDDEKWRMRGGANSLTAIQGALEGLSVSQHSLASNLRFVIYNLRHEDILDGAGLSFRGVE